MEPIYTIALDAMGGDFGPKVTVPAVLYVLSKRSDLNIILVGDHAELSHQLQILHAADSKSIVIKHASQRVEMDDMPAQVLRNKKDSSMRVAINLVKEGRADACVSAGNTGALMATARFVLKTLPGIDRPAIVAALPSVKGHTHVLDLGANVNLKANHLFEFAVMGSVLSSAVDNIDHPSIGLLNVGEEEIKGNDQVKEAAKLIANSELNYIGFVEGDDIYNGDVDVVVCDGFVGNVALKSSEGVAKMISHYLKQEFNKSLFTRVAALIAMPVMRGLQRKIDPRNYNGASLLGLRGIVIKSHGGADYIALANAIEEAIVEVEKQVTDRISHQLESVLLQRRTG